jgi:hypothetical protein
LAWAGAAVLDAPLIRQRPQCRLRWRARRQLATATGRVPVGRWLCRRRVPVGAGEERGDFTKGGYRLPSSDDRSFRARGSRRAHGPSVSPVVSRYGKRAGTGGRSALLPRSSRSTVTDYSPDLMGLLGRRLTSCSRRDPSTSPPRRSTYRTSSSLEKALPAMVQATGMSGGQAEAASERQAGRVLRGVVDLGG